MNNNLKYFIGKACSIFTTVSQRDLRAEDSKHYPASYLKYFLGVIESLDEDGILLTQASRGLKTFIMKDHIIAIAEEQVLDPDNPNDAKQIQDALANIEKIEDNYPKKSQYLDPDAMKKLADNLNRRFSP
jgi:hypothetical protein